MDIKDCVDTTILNYNEDNEEKLRVKIMKIMKKNWVKIYLKINEIECFYGNVH